MRAKLRHIPLTYPSGAAKRRHVGALKTVQVQSFAGGPPAQGGRLPGRGEEEGRFGRGKEVTIMRDGARRVITSAGECGVGRFLRRAGRSTCRIESSRRRTSAKSSDAALRRKQRTLLVNTTGDSRVQGARVACRHEKTGCGRSFAGTSRRGESARRNGLYLFGSTAREETTAPSDLDLFIDYDLGSRFSLVDLVGIKQLLERRLGVPVDLTKPRQPRPAASRPHRSVRRARLLMTRSVQR